MRKMTDEKPGPINTIVRGQRILAIRTALKLSRQAFGDKHNIPKGTLQTWEDGKKGGLSEHGAMRLIKAFSDEDIHCSVEWLLYGQGQPPALPASILTLQPIQIQAPLFTEQQIIQQELRLFRQLNIDSVDAIVPDDAMFPLLRKGNLVAGRRCFEGALEKTVGSNCIVQTHDGKTLIRQIQRGSQSDCYHLVAYNKHGDYPDYKDITLFGAAPIIWYRRKDIK